MSICGHRQQVRRRLRPVPDPPLDGVPRPEAAHARWAAPERVAEVSYGDWTGTPGDSGSDREASADPPRLRHSVWRGWRDDKSPAEIRVEP